MLQFPEAETNNHDYECEHSSKKNTVIRDRSLNHAAIKGREYMPEGKRNGGEALCCSR